MGASTIRLRMVLLATALAVVGLAVLPVAAQAIAGPIYGTVTDSASGDPVYGITVTLYEDTGAMWELVDYAYTDSEGNYTFGSRPGGSYRAAFNEELLVSEYDAVYYAGATTFGAATTFYVTPTVGVRVDQALTFHDPDVIGSVQNADGEPLTSVVVKVYDADKNLFATTYTDINGAFGVRRLTSNDDYYFYFEPSDLDLPFYEPEYWENAATLDDAAVFTYDPMSLPMEFGVVTLETKGPQVVGMVSKEGPDTPIPDIQIQAWQYDVASGTWSEYLPARTYSDWDGSFQLYGLLDSTPDMKWYIRAFDTSGHFASRFYNGQPTTATANEIVVTDGAANGVFNIQLPALAPSASGAVKEAGTNRPIRDCEVLAYTYDTVNGVWSDECAASAWTNSDGEYELYGLYDELTKIVFNQDSNSKLGYSGVWYNGKATPGTATQVTMTTGTTKTGINGVLTRRPVSIKGRLRGNLMPGSRLEPISVYTLEVDLEEWDPVNKLWDSAAGAILDQNGDYAFYGLVNGTYRVSVKDPGGYYYSQYFNGTSGGTKTASAATSIAYTVASGTRVADFTMKRAAWGLTGTVTDTSANGLENISVDVLTYDPDLAEWQSNDIASTSSTGTYALPGPVADGPYGDTQENVKIQFTDSTNKYLQQWANGKASLDVADSISVTFDDAATVVNAALVKGTAAFRGTLSVDGGGAAEGVQVSLYPDLGNDSWPEPLVTTTSDGSGAWELYLAPGITPSPDDYVLSFTSWDGKYADEVYTNKPLADQIFPADSLSGGTRVSWIGPGNTSVVNASLAAQDLSMGGTVTNNNGGGLVSGMGVYAFSSVPSENDLGGPYKQPLRRICRD